MSTFQIFTKGLFETQQKVNTNTIVFKTISHEIPYSFSINYVQQSENYERFDF